MKTRVMKNLFICTFIFFVFSINAQQAGQLITVKLHSKLLEQTITKESPDRNVSIYLPPSYSLKKEKHYPVIYLLHGFAGTDDDWVQSNNKGQKFRTIKSIMDQGIRNGKFGEMIIVMPNQRTNALGSWYANSMVTGKWEDFTIKELVKYIDSNYRTLKGAQSRGIAGHSMGGYGAIRLGMENPDIYSVVYGLNPAFVDFVGDITLENPAFDRITAAKSLNELIANRDVWGVGFIAIAQAFSPNPDNPPFYGDFPYEKKDGKLTTKNQIYESWREGSPSQVVKRYLSMPNKLKGIKFDSGIYDEFKFIVINSRLLSEELTQNGVAHIFEEYNGDHRNRLWGPQGRLYSDVFPYFWELLEH